MQFAPIRGRFAGFSVLLCVALLDQASKAAIIATAASHAIPKEIFSFFNLVLVWNKGISFGMLGHTPAWMPVLLTSTVSTVALALLIWLLRVRDLATGLALGLIIGGALGNIIDRLRFGAVADFLDFHWGRYHFWSFNVADSAIFMGVVILVLISIVNPDNTQENA